MKTSTQLILGAVLLCSTVWLFLWDNPQSFQGHKEPAPDPIQLAVGQVWQEIINKGSPWDESIRTRTILDISNGWVRYRYDEEYTNTMKDYSFVYNSKLMPASTGGQ